MRYLRSMNPMDDYLRLNRDSWNQRTAVHLDSDFYDVEGFLAGKCSLNSIELDLLGDLAGKSLLHLQCHFGQDSLALARRGAKVTGVDLSDKAIEAARALAVKSGIFAEFVCCDLYSLPEHLSGSFDVVFTSYGTVGWLPDLDPWAKVISHFLKPGGHFVMADFHPVLWMMDDDFREITHGYFKGEAIVEQNTGTYTDPLATLEHTEVSWNHSIADILGSLLKQGIDLEDFREFDYAPYDCFRHTIEVAPRRYQIKHLKGKLPMVYAIKGSKN
jgi:SAM-dependent methyltransferase